jgi:hypothetical protein
MPFYSSRAVVTRGVHLDQPRLSSPVVCTVMNYNALVQRMRHYNAITTVYNMV